MGPPPQEVVQEQDSILENFEGDKKLWIVTIDNIFLDVAKDLKNDNFLVENGIKPGS